MKDVIDGIAEMCVSFRREGLKPPTAILLGSPEEGKRFLSAIRQTQQWIAIVGDPSLGKPIEMADGSVWMECSVGGVAVRWPAVKWAKPDGSWSFA